VAGVAPMANRGGGGGGSITNAAAGYATGADGIVIIRYSAA
jgi:hypothetical protein